MAKCEKCKAEFEPPKYTIELVYTTHCKACIRPALIKMANMPISEYIRMQSKSIFK